MQADVVAGLGQRGSLVPAHEVRDQALAGSYRLVPPTTYLAPAAFVEGGDVHRLESSGFSVAFGYHRCGHVSVFSIQKKYGVLEEAVSPWSADDLSRIAGRPGLASARQRFENHGPRARCGSDGAPE